MELKIKYPEHVILLRGNNEVERNDHKKVSAFYGLEQMRLTPEKQKKILEELGYLKHNSFFIFELAAKYGLDDLDEIYEHFMRLFEALPGTIVTAKGLVMTHAAPPKNPDVNLLDIAEDDRIAFEMRKSSIFGDEDPPRNKEQHEAFKKGLTEKPFLPEFLNNIGGKILITGHFSTQSGWVYFGKRVVMHSTNVHSPESGYYLYRQGVGDGCYLMLPLNKEYNEFKEEYFTPVPFAHSQSSTKDILAEYEKDIHERRGLGRLIGKEFDSGWQIERLKFDGQGRMLPFYGLTTISWIENQSPELYQKLCKLQDRIKEKLEAAGMGDVFAYLDKPTFHMTITGIDPIKIKGQEHLYGKLEIGFDKYQQRLAQVKEAFEDIGAPGEVTARIQGIGLGKTVTAMVRFNNARELKKVQDIGGAINEQTGVKKVFSGHISLGYMDKEPEDYQKFIKILQECEEEFGAEEYTFDSFDYTYFSDMGSFKPILTKNLVNGEITDRIEQIAQELIDQGIYKKSYPNLLPKQELLNRIDETIALLKSEETKELLQERIDQIKSNKVFRQGHVIFMPELNEKLIVVTDLHGDLTSLNNILKETGFEQNMQSSNPDMRLVFLGDYINDGLNSTGVLIRVMELKNKYPQHVIMLRGNHEVPDTPANKVRQFYTQEEEMQKHDVRKKMLDDLGYVKQQSFLVFELVAKYGSKDAYEIYDKFLQLFKELPGVVVTAKGIVLAHSAPPHKDSTTDMLHKF